MSYLFVAVNTGIKPNSCTLISIFKFSENDLSSGVSGYYKSPSETQTLGGSDPIPGLNRSCKWSIQKLFNINGTPVLNIKINF
jgi:hypothetical protein